jgi:hypothetical protein
MKGGLLAKECMPAVPALLLRLRSYGAQHQQARLGADCIRRSVDALMRHRGQQSLLC